MVDNKYFEVTEEESIAAGKLKTFLFIFSFIDYNCLLKIKSSKKC